MPGDRERDPRRPGPRLPRRARPGQDADGAAAGRPARPVAADRRAAASSTTTRPRRSAPSARAIVERDGDDDADRLAAARPALRREARHAGHHDRRPDRRGRPDQGRRGPLPVRRADPPLRADPARQPRASSRSTSCPTSPSGSRSACSTSSRSATSRSAASSSACRSTCSSSRRANPEDYTSRGRIITPLKDRLGSQIRTHYPRTLEHEMAIVRQEKHRFPADEGVPPVVVPGVHGGARRRADPPRPALARDQPALRRVASGSASPTPRCSRRPPSSGPSGSASPVGAPRVSRPRRGRRLDRRQGRARDGRRRRARGADRRAAHHEGAVRDVRPGWPASTSTTIVEAFEDGLVIETGDRMPSREYVALDARGPRACRRRSARLGRRRRQGRAEEPPRSSPRRSSSCSRASTSSGGSTRTASRARWSTGDDRPGLHARPARPARPRGRGSTPARTHGRSPGRPATRAGTAASRSPTSTPTRSSTRSPTT